MLRYLGTGKRDYRTHPSACAPRRSWEFQAILKGRAAPSLPPDCPPLPMEGNCLWVFPPEDLHGWTSDRSCEVAVFHFARMPEALMEAYPERGRVHLSPSEAAQVRELACRLAAELARPTLRYSSLVLQAQGVLSWIALKELGAVPATGRRSAGELVEQAMGWFDEHMHTGVGVNELSDRLGMSTSHLRRLFHSVLGQSPGQVVRLARLARAETLLRMGVRSQAEVSGACGFGSAQAFSRFFHKAHGCSPGAWLAGQS